MAVRSELSPPVNPLEILRPYPSGEIELSIGKDRLLIDDKAIVGFGHSRMGVILFVTADRSLHVLTEHTLKTKGLKPNPNHFSGLILTMDLHLPNPEKVFLGEGEYEVQYKGRDVISAYVEVFSTHPFNFERIVITPDDDSNAYLRNVRSSQNQPR